MCWNGPFCEELTDHLGYEHGDPIGHGTGNSRNGSTPKQVLTEIGAMLVWMFPGIAKASFEPRIVTEGCPASGGFQRQHCGSLCPGFVDP